VTPRLSRFQYGRSAAETYDETRAASPSVLAPLRECLAAAPGRRLADIGGGTGNYALELRDADGFEPLVVDSSAEMLRRAAEKGLATLQADAQALPLADASFDAVTLISMLHHVPDWRAALASARRILRPGGRLVYKGFARDHRVVFWPLSYFPSSREWFERTHPSIAETLAELPAAAVVPISFEDVDDASLAALSRRPELVLEAGREGRTSFFGRLRLDAPDELERGLAALERDLRAGRRPELDAEVAAARERIGDALIACWAKPDPAHGGAA
jgi:demethylmenaquinone methyltransferase/2-methoxy-6-polyprenyl-1,4-benzoquinol methylase